MAIERRRRTVRPPVTRPAPHAAFVTFVTLVLAGFLVWASQEVLVPVAIAVLLAFVLTPLADRLRRFIGHVPSVLASVALAIAVVLGLSWALKSEFVEVVEQLPNYDQQIRNKVEAWHRAGGTLGTVTSNLERTYHAIAPATTAPTTAPAGAASAQVWTRQNPLPVRVYDEPMSLGATVSSYLAAVLTHLATVFIVTVFVIFILLGRDDLRDRMIRLAGGGAAQLDVTTRALDDAARRVSRYLVAQLMVNTIYGTLIGVGLWAIGFFFGSADGGGFPSVWVLGLLAGMFRFVPYLGPVIGAVLPLAIALGFFENNAVFFTTAGMFVVIEILVSQFVEPLLYGDKTGMSPIAVLVAAAFWTWLWGPIGLLLSTPLTVVLVVIGRYVPSLHFLQILLGDEPALDPHARVYQRLIMLDRDEAERIAGQVAEAKGLAAAYDEALLPALATAERNLRRGTLHRNQYAFVRDHVAEIGRELAIDEAKRATKKADGDAATAEANRGANAKPATPIDGDVTRGDAEPLGPAPRPPTRVLVIATGGHGDEIAGRLLASVLERRGIAGVEVRTVRERDHAAFEAALARVANPDEGPGDGPGIVVLSAMPPASVARARAACRRTRDAVPKDRQVVGLWTATRDVTDATRKRIDCAQESAVVYTLATAADAVEAAIKRAESVGENATAKAR